MFKLDKEKSNKIVKSNKALLFSSMILLSNKINVYASDVESSNLPPENILIGIIGIGVVVVSISCIHEYRKMEKNNFKLTGTKLDDDKSNDDSEKMVKYLKITNEWKC